MTQPLNQLVSAGAYYWLRHTPERAAGADLAALRRGIGREAGTVPAMWPYYTTLTENGHLSAALRAEHVALTLFAVHQQAQERAMHMTGIGVGTAVLEPKQSEKFRAAAVDRRFSAAATSTSINELSAHLRGLINQLRTIEQPLDYTRLVRDLREWQQPERIGAVRRRWGGQYFTPRLDIPVPAGDGAPSKA